MVFAYSPSPPSTSYATSAFAMDIPTSTTRSRSNSPSTPVAYPSWGYSASKSTSFIISDEELFAPVFDESRDVTPPHTPYTSRSPADVTSAFEYQKVAVDSGSLMRDMMVQEKAKREQQRRRKAAMMRKSSSKSSSGKNMTPIAE